jgi:uncharacterized protein YjbJ (UPF0337 family)
MGMADKLRNMVQKLRGKAMEAEGNATRDPVRRDQGRAEQAGADLKQAGEKAKDVFRR